MIPQPSGKGRRPIRTPLSAPPEEISAEKLNQKLHNAAMGQQDKEPQLELCPSPPKRGSPSRTSPALADPFRRNSAETLPTPPALQRDVVGARRVRSGPKERSPPVANSLTRVKSGPIERRDATVISGNQINEETSADMEKRKKGGERGGSGDKRKKKSQQEEDNTKPKDELVIYYEEHVKPLLSQMEERFAERNVKELCHDCLKLWNALEKKGLIGKASGSFSARRRGEILRTVFKFLDITEPRLLLRLGKLILSVSTSIQ